MTDTLDPSEGYTLINKKTGQPETFYVDQDGWLTIPAGEWIVPPGVKLPLDVQGETS